MRLFLITAKDPVGYDNYDEFLIRAKTELEARELASKQAEHCNGKIFLNAEESSISDVTKHGPSEIIISSFIAG